jgi:ABC-type transport system involved in cytochrome bd biosynthesis fused ATPase/permease subunit
MERVFPASMALLVIIVSYIVLEEYRTWALILLLLFVIFYGLFANPMKKMSRKRIRTKARFKRRKRKKK